MGGRRRPRSAAAVAGPAGRQQAQSDNKYCELSGIPRMSPVNPDGNPSSDRTDNSGNNGGGNRRMTAIFAVLLVASVAYSDTPVTPSLRRLMFETYPRSEEDSSSARPASAAAAPAAPAFSTSHGREIALFGGGAADESGRGRDTAETDVQTEKKRKFDRHATVRSRVDPEEQQQNQLSATGRKSQLLLQQGLQQPQVRKFGKPRKPKLAHARADAQYEQQQQQQRLYHENKVESSTSESDWQRKTLTSLHPRERVISEVGGARSSDPASGAVAATISATSNSDGARDEAAAAADTTKNTKRRHARFVLQDSSTTEVDPYRTTKLNDVSGYARHDAGGGGSSIVMTMLGLVVGLGAALSLAVLLFLADGTLSGGKRRGRAGALARRGIPSRSSSGTSRNIRVSSSEVSSGSISLDSIEEEDPTAAAAAARRKRQRATLSV